MVVVGFASVKVIVVVVGVVDVDVVVVVVAYLVVFGGSGENVVGNNHCKCECRVGCCCGNGDC